MPENNTPTKPADLPLAPAEKTEDELLADKLNTFLAENKIKIVPALSFPIYNKMPVDLELALAVINKHEPKIEMQVIADHAAPIGK